jgi:hypothetical protein
MSAVALFASILRARRLREGRPPLEEENPEFRVFSDDARADSQYQ